MGGQEQRNQNASCVLFLKAPPNKRLHLTANSEAFMREACVISRLNARQVKRSVRFLLHGVTQKLNQLS